MTGREKLIRDSMFVRWVRNDEDSIRFELGKIDGKTGSFATVMSISSPEAYMTLFELMRAWRDLLSSEDANKFRDQVLAMHEEINNVGHPIGCGEPTCGVDIAKGVLAELVKAIPHSGACRVHGVTFADGEGCPICTEGLN